MEVARNMKLYLLFISLLLISLVSAQEDLSNSTTTNIINVTSEEPQQTPDNYCEEQVIDCENFKWIQTYIKKQLDNGTLDPNRVDLVNLLSQANFGLQNELTLCEKRYTPYKTAVYFCGTIIVLLIAWTAYGVYEDRTFGKEKKVWKG